MLYIYIYIYVCVCVCERAGEQDQITVIYKCSKKIRARNTALWNPPINSSIHTPLPAWLYTSMCKLANFIYIYIYIAQFIFIWYTHSNYMTYVRFQRNFLNLREHCTIVRVLSAVARSFFYRPLETLKIIIYRREKIMYTWCLKFLRI